MTDDAYSSDEVSGPAAFWILASLAAAAVAQPSAHRKKHDSFFDGNIDIVRCIPTVCVIDAILDLSILGSGISNKLFVSNPAQRPRRVVPKVSAITVRLALTIFAVLPQTIKVFSLKGLPATQICAFVFFLATITKLLVDLCGLEPEKPHKAPGETEDVDLMGPLVFLALSLQAPFECWIWHNISTHFKLVTDLEALWKWGTFMCILALVMQLLIWIMYPVLRQCLDISGPPHLIPLQGFYLLLVALGAARKPVAGNESEAFIKPPPFSADSFSYTISLMVCTALVSIAATKLLDAVGQLLCLSVGPRTPEAEVPSTVSGESTADEESQRDREETEAPTPEEAPASWMGMTGVIADRWVVRALTLHSRASVGISLMIFNLITTIFYYLVYFDGTGTENPSWTSVFG